MNHELSTICTNCGRTYGAHSDNDCPGNQTTFRPASAPGGKAEDKCMHCKFPWMYHVGVSNRCPTTYSPQTTSSDFKQPDAPLTPTAFDLRLTALEDRLAQGNNIGPRVTPEQVRTEITQATREIEQRQQHTAEALHQRLDIIESKLKGLNKRLNNTPADVATTAAADIKQKYTDFERMCNDRWQKQTACINQRLVEAIAVVREDNEHIEQLQQRLAAMEAQQKATAGVKAREATGGLGKGMGSLDGESADSPSRSHSNAASGAGWIACSDRMPPDNEEVLIYGWIGHTVARYDGRNWFSIWDGDKMQSTPTHWMPLPAKPADFGDNSTIADDPF